MTVIQPGSAADLLILGSNLIAEYIGQAIHLADQRRVGGVGLYDEELAAIGVFTAVCHGQGAAEVVQFLGELIFKRLTPDALTAGAVAVGVAALDHEAINDPMEPQAVVITLFCQGSEVLHCLGSLFGEEHNLNLTHGSGDNCNLCVVSRFCELKQCGTLLKKIIRAAGGFSRLALGR